MRLPLTQPRAFALSALAVAAAATAAIRCGPGLDTLQNTQCVSSVPHFSNTYEDGASGGNSSVLAGTSDCAGNIYLTGLTDSALDGQSKHTVGTNFDYFITKLAPGGARVWTDEDGPPSSGANNRSQALAIAVDAAGNSFITGYTLGSLDGKTAIATNSSQFDFFVSKYDPNGNRLWTIQDGPPASVASNAQGNGIALDSSGNVYVGGFVTGSLDGLAASAFQDTFLAKYDTNGTQLWMIQDKSANAKTSINGVAVDGSGAVFVTGSTEGNLDGQPIPGSATSVAFVSRYDSNGNFNWTTLSGGGATRTATVRSIALDSLGNLYITGDSNGAMGASKNIDGGAKYDFFLSKFDVNSGAFAWAVQDGPGSGMTAQGYSVAATSSGIIYVLGANTGGPVDGLSQHNTGGGYDYFLSRYDSQGNRAWTVEDGAGGSTSSIGLGNSIFMDISGNIYVPGITTATGTGTGLDGRPQVGKGDLFLTQYNSSGTQI